MSLHISRTICCFVFFMGVTMVKLATLAPGVWDADRWFFLLGQALMWIAVVIVVDLGPLKSRES